MRLIFIGPPGAGKGTQLVRVAEYFGVKKISTGDILREQIALKTPLGLSVEETMNRGAYVADDIVLQLVRDRITSEDFKEGFVFDGFPRTLEQADSLWAILDMAGVTIDKVVYINVDDAVIISRMAGRITCSSCGKPYNILSYPPKSEGVCDDCGAELSMREDDKPETVKRRLAIYRELTEPIIDYYEERGLLFEISGVGDADEITRLIIETLNAEE